MTGWNLHVIAVPQIKCHMTDTGDPIFPALKVFQALKFDSSETHNANETVVTALHNRHSETVKSQGEMWDNEPTVVEWGSVTGII